MKIRTASGRALTSGLLTCDLGDGERSSNCS